MSAIYWSVTTRVRGGTKAGNEGKANDYIDEDAAMIPGSNDKLLESNDEGTIKDIISGNSDDSCEV